MCFLFGIVKGQEQVKTETKIYTEQLPGSKIDSLTQTFFMGSGDYKLTLLRLLSLQIRFGHFSK